MVGLPARGKSYISRKLSGYLSWLGYKCKVANLGNYRREINTEGKFQSHSYFDNNNLEGKAERDYVAGKAVDDLIEWLQKENGHVAIYDGTNSTKERRQMVRNKVNTTL